MMYPSWGKKRTKPYNRETRLVASDEREVGFSRKSSTAGARRKKLVQRQQFDSNHAIINIIPFIIKNQCMMHRFFDALPITFFLIEPG